MTTMIKGLLFLSLLFLPLPALSALDIYLNGNLWEHYPEEELAELLIPGENEGPSSIEPVVPLRELLPLMADWRSLRIRILSGEVLLEGDQLAERLNASYLKQTPSGQWQVHSEEDIYASPQEILLTGTPDPVESITVWAEPGLSEYKPLLEYWAVLHKITLNYKEMDHLRDEMIHRKMTGSYLPDFTLARLHPSEPFNPEKTLSYQLRGALTAGTGSRNRIILPQDGEAESELFFSLMASRLGRVDAGELLNSTAVYYNELLNRGIIQKRTTENFLNGTNSYRSFFFPAEDQEEQPGKRSALPALPNRTEPPAARIIPIMLNSTGPAYREEALKAYLLHGGIQYSLFAPEMRRLPAVNLPEGFSEEYEKLYDELQRGFILYEGNYLIWQNLQRNLPILLIRNLPGVSDE